MTGAFFGDSTVHLTRVQSLVASLQSFTRCTRPGVTRRIIRFAFQRPFLSRCGRTANRLSGDSRWFVLRYPVTFRSGAFFVTPPFISPVFKVSYFCGNVICGTRIVCTVQKKKLPFSHKISSTRQKQKTGSKNAPRQIFYN